MKEEYCKRCGTKLSSNGSRREGCCVECRSEVWGRKNKDRAGRTDELIAVVRKLGRAGIGQISREIGLPHGEVSGRLVTLSDLGVLKRKLIYPVCLYSINEGGEKR